MAARAKAALEGDECLAMPPAGVAIDSATGGPAEDAAAARIQRWFRRCRAERLAAQEDVRAMLVAKRAALRAAEEKAAARKKMHAKVASARAAVRAEDAKQRAADEAADAKLHVAAFLRSYRAGGSGDASSSFASPRVPPAQPSAGVRAAVIAAATVSPAPVASSAGGRTGGLRASRSILSASMQSLSTYSESNTPRGGGPGASPLSVASPASADAAEAEVADFSAFIREVAARVIQHYARAWLAGRPVDVDALPRVEPENVAPEKAKDAEATAEEGTEDAEDRYTTTSEVYEVPETRVALAPLLPVAMRRKVKEATAAVMGSPASVASPASAPRTALPTPAARHRTVEESAAEDAPSRGPVPVVQVMIEEEGEAERTMRLETEDEEHGDDSAANEQDGEEPEEDEAPKPRAGMPAMLLERAVEAAAMASAAAEAALDASFEDAVEAISPSKQKVPQPASPDPVAVAKPEPETAVQTVLRTQPAVPSGAEPGASMAEDKLASILSYLDAVEQTNHQLGAAPNGFPALPAAAGWEGVSVAGSVASGFPPAAAAAVAAATTSLNAIAPVSTSFSSAAPAAYSVAMPPPASVFGGDSVFGDGTTAGSSAGALATATTVYEGVRARMECLKKDVARRDALVTKLESELRHAYDRAAADANARLSEMRANHDEATRKHLNFADRLLADKDELAARCTELTEKLACAETRHESTVEELKKAWSAELKRHKNAWEAAERAKREAWEADKTREVKELTIRGLEPEVQRLVQKHRGEIRDLQESHREDSRRALAEATQRHEEYVRSLRERMVRDHQDELEKERLAAAARAREQAERYEAQLHQQRQRAVADAEAAAERHEATRREERARHEEHVARLTAEATGREERAAEQAAAAAAALRRRHEADLAALQGRLDDESAAWRAKVAAKANEALAEKERSVRAQANAERDAEIEAVARRLREEADEDRRRQTGALADRHAAETKDAKARAERAEMAAAAAARAEASAKERAAAAEAELAAVRNEAAARREAAQFLEAQVSNYDEKTAAMQRELRAAFEDRLQALEAAAAAAEKRAVEAERDLGRARERKEEEVAALEGRVRAAIGRKDEAIAQLNAQLAAAQQQLVATEAVLHQQQQEMAQMVGGAAE